jgi:hypothetical protein
LVPRVVVKADKISLLYTILKEELEFVRIWMKKFYDRTRFKGPYLEEGDKVYLVSRNLCIKRPSRKFDFYKIGPFKIDKKISENNYIFALPSIIRL